MMQARAMIEGALGRRGVLGGLAGLAALPLANAALGAAPTSAAWSEAERLRRYMLLRGALDDRIVVFWVRGQMYGDVGGELTALHGVLAATITQYRPHPQGGYAGARAEISYYLDPETGEVADTLHNPYTGETVTPPVRNYPPGPQRILPDVSFAIADHPGATLSQDVTRFETTGRDVLLTEVSKARTQFPDGRVSHYQEMVTYSAPEAQLADPMAKKVLPAIAFTNTVSWRPWMNMGDHPGHLLCSGAGRYVAAMEDLPEAWRRATRERAPAFLEDPEGYLAPVWDKLG